MIKRIRGNRGIAVSFSWMFAIIVGVTVIFLAVYGSVKLVDTDREVSEAETAKQLGILLNPVETGVEEGKLSKIVFSDETRVFNKCDEIGNFGTQKLSTATTITRRTIIPIIHQIRFDFSGTTSFTFSLIAKKLNEVVVAS